MQIRDCITTNVASVTGQDNLFETCCLMRDQNVGAIPVVDSNRLVGVITDRDIAIRGVAEKRPNSLTVDQIMSSSLVYATPDMSVDEAAQLMADAQVRRLPVVENDRLVGIISIGDLAVESASQGGMREAMGEISETHNPQVSNDLQTPPPAR